MGASGSPCPGGPCRRRALLSLPVHGSVLSLASSASSTYSSVSVPVSPSAPAPRSDRDGGHGRLTPMGLGEQGCAWSPQLGVQLLGGLVPDQLVPFVSLTHGGSLVPELWGVGHVCGQVRWAGSGTLTACRMYQVSHGPTPGPVPKPLPLRVGGRRASSSGGLLGHDSWPESSPQGSLSPRPPCRAWAPWARSWPVPALSALLRDPVPAGLASGAHSNRRPLSLPPPPALLRSLLQAEERMQSEVGREAGVRGGRAARRPRPHTLHAVPFPPAPLGCRLSCCLSLPQQIRKLRRELESSQEKVATLTSQLSANVSALTAGTPGWPLA